MMVTNFGSYWKEGGALTGTSSRQTEASTADTPRHTCKAAHSDSHCGSPAWLRWDFLLLHAWDWGFWFCFFSCYWWWGFSLVFCLQMSGQIGKIQKRCSATSEHSGLHILTVFSSIQWRILCHLYWKLTRVLVITTSAVISQNIYD